ncbi:MAG: substrate-binding domain-containing protein, partial [Thermosynechococcaceae cyanobacterium]
MALGIQACDSAVQSKASGNKLVLTGSSTVAPLAAEIAKRYEQENPGVRVDVQSGGSSRGIADVRQQVADIGMVSRS